MTKDDFRKILVETYGARPFYFKTDPECKIIRAKTPAAMANDDSTGRDKIITCKLAALVRIEDVWLPSHQRFFQGFYAK